MDFFFLGIEESLGKDNKFIKLNKLLDFEYFRKALKGIYIQESSNRGRPSYDSVMMFKLLLLGQWYSLSDRALADSLKLRLDFLYFTGFTPTGDLPDYSSICKFRNLLIRKDKLSILLDNLNQQLTKLGLNISHAKGAIIDATLVESAGRPDKYLDTMAEDRKEDQCIKTKIAYGKDADAQWLKKGRKSHYGYKVFTSVDDKYGFIQAIHTESAEVYEGHRLETMLKLISPERLLADKAYYDANNNKLLKNKGIKNRILQKAVKNKPLTKRQRLRNIFISKVRYKVEQCFGTLKRKFNFSRANYFTTIKVHAQALMKACCFNMLKAVNLMA